MVFEYIIIALSLIVLLATLIKFARYINLIDDVNERSSHANPTPRGGGIIIPLSLLLYAIIYHKLSYFFIGVLIIGAISFIDDVKGVSNKWRLLTQFLAVIFLLKAVFSIESNILVYLPLVIVIMGTLNAVNFMDGINGITVAFGTVFLSTLLYFNTQIYFVDQKLLVYAFIAIFVFGLFNFRTKACCFAGDVGSISLGFILVYLTLLLYQKLGDVSVIVLWTVYGVDSVLTIVHRLIKKKNIFKAHRSHLYQYYANELKVSHLKIALVYGALQAVINTLLLYNLKNHIFSSMVFLILVLLISGIVYISLRVMVINKISVVKT